MLFSKNTLYLRNNFCTIVNNFEPAHFVTFLKCGNACKSALCSCQSQCELFDDFCFQNCYQNSYKDCEAQCSCGSPPTSSPSSTQSTTKSTTKPHENLSCPADLAFVECPQERFKFLSQIGSHLFLPGIRVPAINYCSINFLRCSLGQLTFIQHGPCCIAQFRPVRARIDFEQT